MMIFALLTPFALLAVLLGMDRLERWTIDATSGGDTEDPLLSAAAAPTD